MYDVLDSSVWVWGLTEQAPAAETLVEEVLEGDRYAGVDAYIHGEVMNAFDRSRTAGSGAIKHAKNTFNVIIAKRHNVDFPDQAEVGKMNVHRVRADRMVELLGQSWDIQPKDVPIVVFASEYDDVTTVFTADRNFSEFEPESHGIDDVEIEYVPTP